VIATGSVAHCAVGIADVLRFVILSGAVSFIVSHNHPSGDPTPSRDDIELTRRLGDAARLCGLRMIDHVIVGDQPDGLPPSYVSFVDAGLHTNGAP
jgi:DNA repair protein RadC